LALSVDGEPGQNYLCPGLELFFMHTGPAFQAMAKLLQQGRAPADLMSSIASEDARRGRNEPCPCGSGRKFKHCSLHSLFGGLQNIQAVNFPG
jgi:uncharacterized protein